MSKLLKEPRITYISFLECELRGYWANNASKGKSTEDHWIAKKSGCSMWVVRQDSQRRGRIFRQGAQIILSGNTGVAGATVAARRACSGVIPAAT